MKEIYVKALRSLFRAENEDHQMFIAAARIDNIADDLERTMVLERDRLNELLQMRSRNIFPGRIETRGTEISFLNGQLAQARFSFDQMLIMAGGKNYLNQFHKTLQDLVDKEENTEDK